MKPATPLVLSTGISGGSGSSFYQPRTPGNPTEVETIITDTVAVNAPTYTAVTGGVVIVISKFQQNEKSLELRKSST